MAAIIHLPSSPKLAAVADKAPDAQVSGNGQNGEFSQALSQQMEKKQAPVESKANAGEPPAAVDKSADSRASAAETPSASPASGEPAESETATTTADVTSPQETAEQTALQAEAAMVQSISLQELLGIGYGQISANGTAESGNELPEVASLRSVTIAEMLVTRNARNLSADVQGQIPAGTNSQPEAPDETTLLALQQRVEQQLALPAQAIETTEGLKQTLQGVENALQALQKLNGKSSEIKGLEQAREQLMARLQGLQGQNAQAGAGNADQQGTGSRLPFMQTLSTEEGGKLADVAKLTRIAFQEMLTQQHPNNGQGQAASLSAAPAVSMNSLSAMLAPVEGGNPLLNYAPASSSVNVPVNHPAWGQAIGERLQWMVKQEVQQAEIKLNPRNMGPIEIKISMNQDQATVSFVANHAMTREALDAALPKLREMFGESGLNLVDVNVSQNPDTNGQRANERSDESAKGRSARFGSDNGVDEASVDGLAQGAAQASIWHSSNGVLDAYA